MNDQYKIALQMQKLKKGIEQSIRVPHRPDENVGTATMQAVRRAAGNLLQY